MAKYFNPAIEFSDIVAISGLGSFVQYRVPPPETKIPVSFFNLQPQTEFIITSLNLNTSFHAGIAPKGSLNGVGPPSDFPYPNLGRIESNAEDIVYFNNSDEAVNYLKKEISKGNPAIVYLEHYYLQDDFLKVSENWKSRRPAKPGDDWSTASFFTVTGYDEEYVYINDPGDPSGLNLPAKIDNFRLAWERTGTFYTQLGKPVNGNPYGPYWMISLSHIGNMKPLKEVIAMDVIFAEYSIPQIRKFALNPIDYRVVRQGFSHLSVARVAFADFLNKNNMEKAAELYRKSGYLFDTLNQRGPNAKDLNAIADLEEQALKLLYKN